MGSDGGDEDGGLRCRRGTIDGPAAPGEVARAVAVAASLFFSSPHLKYGYG